MPDQLPYVVYDNPEAFVPDVPVFPGQPQTQEWYMPAPIIAAGIGAGSSILGGIFGNRAQSKATDAQLQANREALGYQKQQDLMRRMQAAKLWDATNAQRALLFQRYGLQMPEMGNPYQDQMGAGGGMPGAAPRGTTLADLIARNKPIQQYPE